MILYSIYDGDLFIEWAGIKAFVPIMKLYLLYRYKRENVVPDTFSTISCSMERTVSTSSFSKFLSMSSLSISLCSSSLFFSASVKSTSGCS